MTEIINISFPSETVEKLKERGYKTPIEWRTLIRQLLNSHLELQSNKGASIKPKKERLRNYCPTCKHTLKVDEIDLKNNNLVCSICGEELTYPES